MIQTYASVNDGTAALEVMDVLELSHLSKEETWVLVALFGLLFPQPWLCSGQ